MPAPCCRRTILTLCLTLLTIGPFPLASAEEPELWKKQEQRLKAEATALFKVILKDQTFGRCELDNEWDHYPVPYHMAMEYLGHTLRADLDGLEIGATTPEIINPGGEHPERLCSFQELQEELSRRINKALAAGSVGEKVDPELYTTINRGSFSFPVFDRKFQTALVIRHASSHRWLVRDGKVRRLFDQTGGVEVYRKKKGRWRFIKHENAYHTHGG